MPAFTMGPEDTAAEWTGPSQRIWGKMPIHEIVANPHGRHGGFLFEDFNFFPCPATNLTLGVKEWRVFMSNGGTILDGGLANVSAIKATSDDDNEAVVMAMTTAPVRITRKSQRKVACEYRVRFDSITDTKNGAFFGLFEPLEPTATTHIGDDGAMTDKNFIGFHRLEGDGDKIDFVYKADGITQVSFTDALTLVADTWYKVGFLFNGDDTVTVYFDGAEYTTAQLGVGTSYLLSSTSFPSDVNLSPAMVLHKAATGTAEGTNFVDWVCYGYTSNIADGIA